MYSWYITLFVIFTLFFSATVINLRGKRLNGFSPWKYPQPENLRYKTFRPANFALGLLMVLVMTVGLFYQLWRMKNISFWTTPVVFISFLWMNFLLFSSFTNREYLPVKKIDKSLRVVVVVPVYNEHPKTVQKVLESISGQSRLPNVVCIVEDGSAPENKCDAVCAQWQKRHPGLKLFYTYVPNGGKREAQAIVFRKYMGEADVFLTMDSDTLLHRDAIKNGIAPFQDPTVQAVGGLLMAYNNKTFLNKIVALSFVSSFTNGRAAWSRWNSVSVNCGGLAFYRSRIISEFLEEYLTQRVFGEKARYGDDRMLTQYASLRGRTVYQENSIGYTLLPENINHLTRQRIRWWKSFWWGGLWVIRHQSMKRGIWWLTLSQYTSFVLYSIIFPIILIINPIINRRFPVDIFIYMGILSYIRTARTLLYKQRDCGRIRQFLEWIIMAPLSTFFNLYLTTGLQYVSLFRLKEVKSWGTREQVEVSMEETAAGNGRKKVR